ncbi:hypothetical protein EGM_21255, partial [Macaca fascicularis]
GDGGEHLDSEEEEGPRPMPSVPEDQESWEAMVPFFKSAGASAQEEQARLSEQVKEQRVCCQHLAHPVVLSQKESEAAVPAPGTGGESVSGETPWTLQEVMEKLSYTRTHFRLPHDLKVPPEGRSLSRCDPITLAPERAYGPPGGEGGPENVHHFVTEPGASAKDAAMGGGHHQAGPGQGGDEGEAVGAAGDAVATCGDYNKGHHKFLATAQNPADEPGPGAPAPQETGDAHKHG